MDLDSGYVRDAGEALRYHLHRRGRPCELAYTPGNGTLYELAFVPLGLCGALESAAHDMDHAKARSIFKDRPELAEDDSWVLVCWVGHGCYPFQILREQQMVGVAYVAEKFAGCTHGDALALVALFDAARGGFSVAAA